MKAASAYVRNGRSFAAPHFIAHRTPVEIGPFRVTPYLVDHSAFDAYSLLVEADGKRVFYSGDFRGHGRKRKLFESMVARPPKDIDVLLMEGTTIGRTGTDEGFATEDDLEQEFVRAFRETKGLHFVWTSSQNIDRVVTIFRAAKRTGRVLIVDLYTAVVLEATGRDSIPQSSWDEVKVYVPQIQRVSIKKKGLFADLGRHGRNRVFWEHLPDLAGQAVMLFRPMAMTDGGVNAVLDGAGFTYSMWDGYLKEKGSLRVLSWLKRHGIPRRTIHHLRSCGRCRPQAVCWRLGTALTRPNTLFRDGSVRGVFSRCRSERGRQMVGSLERKQLMPKQFNRGISEAFVQALNCEYEKDGWWTRLVSDKRLFVGIRENCLNVYYKGASVLELRYIEGRFVGRSHFKYLLNQTTDRRSDYVQFTDGEFAPVAVKESYRDLAVDNRKDKELSSTTSGCRETRGSRHSL